MNKLCAVLASVTVFTVSLPFLPAAAADAGSAYDLYQRTLAEFALSDVSVDSELYFAAGYYVNSSGQRTGTGSLLLLDAVWYLATYTDGAEQPYSFEQRTADAAWLFNAKYTGPYYCRTFYYDPSETGCYILTHFFCSDQSNYTVVVNAKSSYSDYDADYYYYTGTPSGGTADSMVSGYPAFTESEPTTSSASGGFQLPDDWVNGGETLPDATIDTFEGVDVTEAEEQLESIMESVNPDGLNETNVPNAIGLFWELVRQTITSLDVWFFVYVSMILTLIAWVLGR